MIIAMFSFFEYLCYTGILVQFDAFAFVSQGINNSCLLRSDLKRQLCWYLMPIPKRKGHNTLFIFYKNMFYKNNATKICEVKPEAEILKRL